MLSRALILATVMLSILLAAPDVQAQNLEAGKSPSQIFSTSCAVCHRSPRGLLKTVPPGSLPGFLREHYTTSKDMAQQLSGFLLGNGATDPRGGSRLTKQGEDSRSGRPSEPQPPGRRPRPGQPQDAARPDAARPDADGLTQPEPPAARGKRGRQQQAAPGPDGAPVPAEEPPLTKRQKQKIGKKKGREEPQPAETAKPDAATPDVVAPADTPPAAEIPTPPEPAPVVIDPKVDTPTPESVRPAEPAAPRSDPVPQVTPAPPSPAPAEAPAAPPPSDAPRPTISVTPPPPPPQPSGPATPPISQ